MMNLDNYVVDENATKAKVTDERYPWCCIADRFKGKLCRTPKKKEVCRFATEDKFYDHHQRVHGLFLVRKDRASHATYSVVDDGHTGLTPEMEGMCQSADHNRVMKMDHQAGIWAKMGQAERQQSMVMKARATRSQMPIETID